MPKPPRSIEPPSEPRFLTGPIEAVHPTPVGVVVAAPARPSQPAVPMDRESTPPSGPPCALFGVAVSDQDRFIGVAHENGIVGLYQPVFAEKMGITGPFLAGRGHENARSIAFEPGSWRGYVCLVSGGVDGSIRTWHLGDKAQNTVLRHHEMCVHALAFDTEGTRLVSACEDGTIAIRSWPDATLERSFRAHTRPVLSVAVSPNGKQIASGGFDSRAYLWSTNGKRLARLDGDDGGWVWSIRFIDDERVLFSQGGTLFEWTANSGCRRCFTNDSVYSLVGLAVRADRREVAFGDGRDVVTLELATGVTRRRRGHEGTVHGTAYLADGRIASTGGDGALLVWSDDDEPALRLRAGSP